ncbi:MAG: class I SAM-dependent methyltransferase [Bacilli bacterium]
MTNSKRIAAIESFIDINDNVADIGSDHGYLLIDLYKMNHDGRLLGVENKKGPFKILSDNIHEIDKNSLIKISLSDGLDDVDTKAFETIVIAGMGFDSIKQILDRNINKVSNIEKLIVDSHTKNKELREYLINLGFQIDDEEIIFEKGKYYEIEVFIKGQKKYSQIQIKYGPILLKEKSIDFINKYKDELIKLEDLVNNDKITKGKKDLLINEIIEKKEIIS